MADRRLERFQAQALKAAQGLVDRPAADEAADEPTVAAKPSGMLNYAYIESSAIKGLRYDAAAQTMEITFPSGHTYQYFGVGPDEIYYFSLADSLGKYFNANIKNRYGYARVN